MHPRAASVLDGRSSLAMSFITPSLATPLSASSVESLVPVRQSRAIIPLSESFAATSKIP